MALTRLYKVEEEDRRYYVIAEDRNGRVGEVERFFSFQEDEYNKLVKDFADGKIKKADYRDDVEFISMEEFLKHREKCINYPELLMWCDVDEVDVIKPFELYDRSNGEVFGYAENELSAFGEVITGDYDYRRAC